MILILGAGYTGSRAAALLRAGGHEVVETSGRRETFAAWSALPPGLRVIYTIPPGEEEADRFAILSHLASRLVYISSTGMYGSPDHRRAASEERVQNGPWSWLILRSAAIYGPGRGVHASLRQGRYRLTGDGSNFISRIHVDDLAALCAAAVLSDATGIHPAADSTPAPQREVVDFCCRLLHLPWPASVPPEQQHETLRHNRQIKGDATFALLRVPLRYPSYREGIPASIAAEEHLST